MNTLDRETYRKSAAYAIIKRYVDNPDFIERDGVDLVRSEEYVDFLRSIASRDSKEIQYEDVVQAQYLEEYDLRRYTGTGASQCGR